MKKSKKQAKKPAKKQSINPVIDSGAIKAKKVTLVNIDKLTPNDKNPNTHSEEQIERLSKLIQTIGFRNPVVVSNRSGLVISGHGRIAASKKIGLKKVPVIFQDFSDEASEYQYMVSENEISRWSETDYSMVHKEMMDLGPDFDIELLGIKDFEVCLEDKEKDKGNSPAWNDSPKFFCVAEFENENDANDLLNELQIREIKAEVREE